MTWQDPREVYKSKATVKSNSLRLAILRDSSISYFFKCWRVAVPIVKHYWSLFCLLCKQTSSENPVLRNSHLLRTPSFSSRHPESKAWSTLNFYQTISTRTRFWWKFTVCPLTETLVHYYTQGPGANNPMPVNSISCNSLPSSPSTNVRCMNST